MVVGNAPARFAETTIDSRAHDVPMVDESTKLAGCAVKRSLALAVERSRMLAVQRFAVERSLSSGSSLNGSRRYSGESRA
jgi:hypothetical protein